MFIEVELARSATMAAARALDATAPDAARLVSMKHARTCELTFGDAAFHRERFARLSGY